MPKQKPLKQSSRGQASPLMRKLAKTSKPLLKALKPRPGRPYDGTVSFGPGQLVMTIKGTPPNYANARMHWRVKHVSVTLWSEFIESLLRVMPLGWEIKRPKLTLTLYGMKEPDFDNLVSRWKPILDGLVRAKIIQDDRLSVIGSPTFRWVKAQKQIDQRVHIVVESGNEEPTNGPLPQALP